MEVDECHETLYKLIISQLMNDGLDSLALSLTKRLRLAKHAGMDNLTVEPSARLLELLMLGIRAEKQGTI